MLGSLSASRILLAAGVSLAAASFFCACESQGARALGPTTPVDTTVSVPEPVFVEGESVAVWIDDFEPAPSVIDTTAADSAAHDPATHGSSATFGSYVTLRPEFIHLDQGAGIGGSTAVRFDWTRATDCNDDSRVIERSFPASPELYVQFFVRYTKGFVFDWLGSSPCSGNAKKLFFLWARSGSRFDVISENHAIGVGSDYDHPLFAQSGARPLTPELLADGAWHRFTFHVRQSSAPTASDGMVQGWIDGVLRWSRSGIPTFNSDGYYAFKLPTTFNQGSPATQSEWLDGLKIWR